MQPARSSTLYLIYSVLGVVLTILTFTIPPWTLILLWPAFTMFVVAYAYMIVSLGPRIFMKRNGRIALPARILLAAYFVGLALSRRYYWRKTDPWNTVTPNVLLGRLVTDEEAKTLIDTGVHAVLDLTAEHSECRRLRDLVYLNVPVLDLTVPNTDQLHKAADFIEQYAADGIVYVHCGLGYSRSAMAVAAWLLKIDKVANSAESIAIVHEARPGVVLRSAHERVLDDYRISLSRPGQLNACSPAKP